MSSHSDAHHSRFLRMLGLSVRLARVERAWTQERLGILAGLERTYIGAIERGERNVGICNVVQLAGALGLPLSELIHRAERLQGLHDQETSKRATLPPAVGSVSLGQ